MPQRNDDHSKHTNLTNINYCLKRDALIKKTEQFKLYLSKNDFVCETRLMPSPFKKKKKHLGCWWDELIQTQEDKIWNTEACEVRRSKEKDEHQVKDHKACEIFKSKHKTVSPSESEGEKRIREMAISLVAPILNARKASWSEKMFLKKNLQRKDDCILIIDHWLTFLFEINPKFILSNA